MTAAEFRKIRQSLGLSISDLARMLGVSRKTAERWEYPEERSLAARNPAADTALRWLEDGWRPPEWPD